VPNSPSDSLWIPLSHSTASDVPVSISAGFYGWKHGEFKGYPIMIYNNSDSNSNSSSK
jgi:hypothetical protein